MADQEKNQQDETGGLCLDECEECDSLGYRGACSKDKDHLFEHKCNAASGKTHTWSNSYSGDKNND